MSTIRNVLLPLDVSPVCPALAPTVRRMVETWSAEVTLLHIVQNNDSTGRKRQLERLMTQMGMIGGKHGCAAYLHCRMERGVPADRILEHVRENAVDLIVLSSGGSPNPQGFPIGSVSDRLLNEAPCPVWLEWSSARSRQAAGMSAQSVTCALELKGFDEPVLRQAAEIAIDLGARLRVIHALFPAPGEPLAVLWSGSAREHARRLAHQRIAALCSNVFPSAEIVVEVGSSHTVISRALRRKETGLLVTGNARAAILAAESACPVLRVPARASALSRPQVLCAAAGA